MALYRSAKGSVNYTVVGSPTIVDGIASGFSNSDFVQVGKTGLTSWEGVELVIASPTYFSTQLSTSTIFGKKDDFYIYARNTGYIQSDIASSSQGIAPRNTQVKKIKIVFTDTQTFLYYSTDAISFTLYNTVNAVPSFNKYAAFCFGAGSYSYAYDGSIDLNHTYIKVNGQPWFGLCPVEVQKHQLKGPVGYTKVGSPTIVDGVVSGFSSSNYLRLNGVIDFTQSFELFTELIIDEPKAGWYPVIRFKNYYTIAATNNSLVFIANSSAPATVKGFKLNRYYCKFSWNVDTSTVTLAVSPDKITWYENSGTFTPGSGYSNLIIGTNISEGSFNGSIDLNNTYIKVNGKLWFYQPAPTKYIVKDGKLVWADPRIYLQSQSSANEVRPYIDTGYIPTVNTTYEWTAQFLINTGFMFGANAGDSLANRLGHNYASGKDFVWTTIGYQSKSYEVGRTFFSKYTSHTDADGYCYLNGTNVGRMTLNTGGGSTTKHMWLFGASANDDSETYVTSGASGYSTRIYNFKLYESGLLVRNFVPVPAGLKIGSFTAPSNGMFDIVNQQFYGKVGSSLYDFTIGRDE